MPKLWVLHVHAQWKYFNKISPIIFQFPVYTYMLISFTLKESMTKLTILFIVCDCCLQMNF